MRARDRARALAVGIALVAACLAAGALAQPSGPADAGPGRDDKVWASCTEHLPPGAARPTVEESFPERGLSGYEARLEVVIHHGQGETVLPEGFHLQLGSDAARAIESAGFTIPHVDGGSPPRVQSQVRGQETVTTVSLPFVPLPREAGRHALVLPPIPIAVARASGEVMTLCTQPQSILVDDPIANESDPKVRPNPPPGPQREEWVLAEQIAAATLVALVLAVLFAWLIRRWLSRPRPVKPKPRVLPWIAALQELEQIRQSNLIAKGHTDEYFDRVSDCIRFYLGARYGFDGLESTTEETRLLLARVRPAPPDPKSIIRYLEECDLVKFADLRATAEDCDRAMAEAKQIVARTTPPPTTGSKRRGSGTGASGSDEPRRAA